MEESLKDRQEVLFIMVDNLIMERDDWAANPQVLGLPVGGPPWMAASDCVRTYETGTIPGSCRNLCEAVMAFARYWNEHASRAEVSQTDDLLPGNNVWSAMDSIAAARRGAAPKQSVILESVADLVKQKVTDMQIAKIYKWTDSLGHPDLAKVRAAKEQPGKFDGVAHQRQQQDRAQQLADDNRRQADQVRERIDARRPRGPQPVLDSIETLIAQGLNVAQIARNKVMPPEQVLVYCRENGIQLTGSSVSSVQRPVATNGEPEIELGEDRTFDETFPVDPDEDQLLEDTFDPPEGESLSIDDQILLAHEERPDAKCGVLAELLGCSAQKVNSVIRKNEIPEPA